LNAVPFTWPAHRVGNRRTWGAPSPKEYGVVSYGLRSFPDLFPEYFYTTRHGAQHIILSNCDSALHCYSMQGSTEVGAELPCPGKLGDSIGSWDNYLMMHSGKMIAKQDLDRCLFFQLATDGKYLAMHM
jgi:hypothetical protein